MRTAVFSDIHANLEALEATCGAIDGLGVDEWICLGDVVGYGADPGLCLQRTRALGGDILLGNHDAAVAGLLDLAYFNALACEAALWTQAELSALDREYLSGLSLTLTRSNSFFVHAEPVAPTRWDYVETHRDVERAMDAVEERLCFIGHSHRACASAVDPAGRVESVAQVSGAFQLLEGHRYLVNVGSVGQPRDGDARACCAVVDDETETVEFVRTAYNIAAAQVKIRRAGLPSFLAERLQHGH